MMAKTWRAVVVMAVVVSSGAAGAAERDLDAGLAYLRAGAQAQAAKYLGKYRDEAKDPEVRKRLGRVLPLLQRPLSEDMREFLADVVEESARTTQQVRRERVKRGDLSRAFPVFP